MEQFVVVVVINLITNINLIGNILNNENAISSKLCCCIQQADECYRSRDEYHSSQ